MKKEDLPVASQMLANFGKHTRFKNQTQETLRDTQSKLVSVKENEDEHSLQLENGSKAKVMDSATFNRAYTVQISACLCNVQ